jgi:hypothetical protein
VLIKIHPDRQPEGIVGTQVARNLIIQGGLAIQTMVSPRGYVLTSEELWDERWVTPNRCWVPSQLEECSVM